MARGNDARARAARQSAIRRTEASLIGSLLAEGTALRGTLVGRKRLRNERAIDMAVDDGGQKSAPLLMCDTPTRMGERLPLGSTPSEVGPEFDGAQVLRVLVAV